MDAGWPTRKYQLGHRQNDGKGCGGQTYQRRCRYHSPIAAASSFVGAQWDERLFCASGSGLFLLFDLARHSLEPP